jgi:hypothetical protein
LARNVHGFPFCLLISGLHFSIPSSNATVPKAGLCKTSSTGPNPAVAEHRRLTSYQSRSRYLLLPAHLAAGSVESQRILVGHEVAGGLRGPSRRARPRSGRANPRSNPCSHSKWDRGTRCMPG